MSCLPTCNSSLFLQMGVWFPNRNDIHRFICDIDNDTTNAKIEAILNVNFKYNSFFFKCFWHYGLTTYNCQFCFPFQDGV